MKPIKRQTKTPSKLWLGKRLTCTENDGIWCDTGKHHQIILQHASDGLWYGNVSFGRLTLRAEHKREDCVRQAIERQLRWYGNVLGKALAKVVSTRALPPVYNPGLKKNR